MPALKTLGVVTSLPAANVTPSGALTVENVNSLSVSGQITAGSGKLYLLRRFELPGAAGYQYRLWRADRPIVADATLLSGYFDGIWILPDNCGPESFVLYNPGALTMAAGSPTAFGETLSR